MEEKSRLKFGEFRPSNAIFHNLKGTFFSVGNFIFMLSLVFCSVHSWMLLQMRSVSCTSACCCFQLLFTFEHKNVSFEIVGHMSKNNNTAKAVVFLYLTAIMAVYIVHIFKAELTFSLKCGYKIAFSFINFS